MKKLLLNSILLSGLFAYTAFAENTPQPYYFSDALKQSVQDCSAYSEDVFEKNPDLKEYTLAFPQMMMPEADWESAKMLLNIIGKEDDKCHIILKHDFPYPMAQEFDCHIPQGMQNKLLTALNDTSTERKRRTIPDKFGSTTITGREFDLTMPEMLNNYCEFIDKEPTEEDLRQLEDTEKKMMAFSEDFKTSLQKCEPNKTDLKIMGTDVQEVEILEQTQGKCHLASNGFHILLTPQELNLGGFDEFNSLLTDEARATYNPAYRYEGILLALAECDALKKAHQETSGMSSGDSEISLGEHIKIQQGMSQSRSKGICKIIISQIMSRNGNEKNYSLRCDVIDENTNKILNYYADILKGNLPKISRNSYTSGNQTAEIALADKETFIQLYKNGICKSVALYPPVNSLGCPASKPLRGGWFEGECYSCDDLETIKVKNRKECEEVCDGSHGRARRKIESFDNCVLASCPADRPLKDSGGTCQSCDFEGPLEDDNCSVCPNRKIKGSKCVIADCSNRPLKDTNGNCYPCDTEESVQIFKGQCTSVCPNRKETGSWRFGEVSGTFCDLVSD